MTYFEFEIIGWKIWQYYFGSKLSKAFILTNNIYKTLDTSVIKVQCPPPSLTVIGSEPKYSFILNIRYLN